MDEEQISFILTRHLHTKKHFAGVLAADEVTFFRKNRLYVFNTEVRSKVIGHWITVFVDKTNVGFVFDSLGEIPWHDHLLKGLSKTKHFFYNSTPLQHRLSYSCGVFSILAAIYLCRGLNIPQIRLFFKTGRENMLKINEHLAASLLCTEIVIYVSPLRTNLLHNIRTFSNKQLESWLKTLQDQGDKNE